MQPLKGINHDGKHIRGYLDIKADPMDVPLLEISHWYKVLLQQGVDLLSQGFRVVEPLYVILSLMPDALLFSTRRLWIDPKELRPLLPCKIGVRKDQLLVGLKEINLKAIHDHGLRL